MMVGEVEMRGMRKGNGQFGVVSSEFGVTIQQGSRGEALSV